MNTTTISLTNFGYFSFIPQRYFHTKSRLFATPIEKFNVKLEKTHKVKFIVIYFKPEEFQSLEMFILKLKDSLDFSSRYSFLFRVCYGGDATFKMLGFQVGFYIKENWDVNQYLLSMHDLMKLRIESSMHDYGYSGNDIISIQILVYKVNYTENVIKSYNIFNTDNLDFDLVDTPKYKMNLVGHKILPLSMDLSLYGNSLENEELKEFYNSIDDSVLKIDINDNTLNFLSDKGKYVTLINKFILPDSRIKHEISVFTREGYHIFNVIDITVNDKTFTRTIGNTMKIINIEDESLFNTKINMNLSPIKINKKEVNENRFTIADPFVGTFDLETYNDGGISKVYALGFYTKQYGINTFYIDETFNSEDLILRCLEALISNKYDGFTFYVHNLGRFDIYFILKILVNSEKYKVNILSRGDLILSVTIKSDYTVMKKVYNKKTKTYNEVENKIDYSIKLVDSYNLLTHSLDTLCKTFDTEVVKSIFPYEFMSRNTLFYKGDKPDKKYYDKKLTNKLYDQLSNS